MEKKEGKISLSTIFLTIAFIVIVVMMCFMYKIYNDKEIADSKIEELTSQTNNLQSELNSLQDKVENTTQMINNVEKTENLIEVDSKLNNTDNDEIILELGNYTVDQVMDDEGGVSNSECGVELKENNEFIIYMGYGVWHLGKYELKNNQLICKSTQLEWDGGAGPGQKSTDVIFSFDIINQNKLKLLNIDINDKNNEKLVYPEGLSIGMTYSKK